jgi:hypothetical protein
MSHVKSSGISVGPRGWTRRGERHQGVESIRFAISAAKGSGIHGLAARKSRLGRVIIIPGTYQRSSSGGLVAPLELAGWAVRSLH